MAACLSCIGLSFRITRLCEFYLDKTADLPYCAYSLVQAAFDKVKLAKLEAGVEIADLNIRIGFHSGPVTAGVLRGDRCAAAVLPMLISYRSLMLMFAWIVWICRGRFQLFGDTVNTASRMESTGAPGCIQVSTQARDIILGERNEFVHHLAEREGRVAAKGKGELVTYWLTRAGLEGDMFVAPAKLALVPPDDIDVKPIPAVDVSRGLGLMQDEAVSEIADSRV